MPDLVRIGAIGAGGFTLQRMLPAFHGLPGVQLTAVANRTRESTERVAEQFGIMPAADYREVLARPDVDAVLIGAPPYLHRDAVFAALDAGKHVLCQTRIATTAADARAMHERAEAARARGVRTMLVPPAPFYRGSLFIKHLVTSGFLGSLRHVQSFNVNDSFADPATPLSAGRNDPDLYGPFNAMQLGLSYDVMAQWTGRARGLVAHRATFVPERPLTPGGPMTRNPYPDAVTVIAETESGAVASNLLNYAIRFADTRVELYGAEGTVVYRREGDSIMGARAGGQALKPMPIPPEYDRPWQVEEEFVRLVRGEIQSPSFTFWDGVRNMEYLEAAFYSATQGRRVDLPE